MRSSIDRIVVLLPINPNLIILITIINQVTSQVCHLPCKANHLLEAPRCMSVISHLAQEYTLVASCIGITGIVELPHALFGYQRFVHVYSCVHVCMCIHTYVRTYVCMYVCTCVVHVFIHVYYVHMHACTYIHVNMYVHVYAHMWFILMLVQHFGAKFQSKTTRSLNKIDFFLLLSPLYSNAYVCEQGSHMMTCICILGCM